MRIFLFEHLCGGGELGSSEPWSGSLASMGRSMLVGLGQDLREAGCEVRTLEEPRVTIPGALGPCRVRSASEAFEAFDAGTAWADGVIVIAPETGGRLRAWRRRAGSKALNGSPEAIGLCEDKARLNAWLRGRGVKTPVAFEPGAGAGVSAEAGAGASELFVIKPRDGAGAESTRRVRVANGTEAARLVEGVRESGRMAERWVKGVAASVLAVVGPACGEWRAAGRTDASPESGSASEVEAGPPIIREQGADEGPDQARGRRPVWLLPACEQRIHVAPSTGTLSWRGGRAPLERSLQRRSLQLARRGLDAVPGLRGWVGVDLVLAADGEPEGADDVVIEINPRLTMSYLAHRRRAAGPDGGARLARRFLDIASGRTDTDARSSEGPAWLDDAVAFDELGRAIREAALT